MTMRRACTVHLLVRLFLPVLIPFWLAIGVCAQTAESGSISLPTQSRIRGGGWLATKGDASREKFIGTSGCALCHFEKASTYKAAAMSQASISPLQSEGLCKHERLDYQLGPYCYE